MKVDKWAVDTSTIMKDIDAKNGSIVNLFYRKK